MINKEERKLLIELICNEQTHMIIKDSSKYESDKYKKLEELKVKIKDLNDDMEFPDCIGMYENFSSYCTKECNFREKCEKNSKSRQIESQNP